MQEDKIRFLKTCLRNRGMGATSLRRATSFLARMPLESAKQIARDALTEVVESSPMDAAYAFYLVASPHVACALKEVMLERFGGAILATLCHADSPESLLEILHDGGALRSLWDAARAVSWWHHRAEAGGGDPWLAADIAGDALASLAVFYAARERCLDLEPAGTEFATHSAPEAVRALASLSDVFSHGIADSVQAYATIRLSYWLWRTYSENAPASYHGATSHRPPPGGMDAALEALSHQERLAFRAFRDVPLAPGRHRLAG